MRIIAVDWSGKVARAEEYIWLAEVADSQLVRLENGRNREQLIGHLIKDTRARGEPTIVGLDFAFSFPRWWCEARGWTAASEVWAAVESEGEQLLAACEFPFWGRRGKPNPHAPARAFRRTDRADTHTAKSVFQIGGAGAVGTGSIRGIKYLPVLAAHGFGIWPFTAGGPRRLVEIYPRALTGPVNKSRWKCRHDFLLKRFPTENHVLLERAAGSEDAFDAAASALVMAAHADELSALAPSDDPCFGIEGRIWRPSAGGVAAALAA